MVLYQVVAAQTGHHHYIATRYAAVRKSPSPSHCDHHLLGHRVTV